MSIDTRRNRPERPVAVPQARRFDHGKGAAYDAAMEQLDGTARRLDAGLGAAIREAPPEITTTGQLAELLAQLDPDTPLALAETIQAQGDWDSPGGTWRRSVIADHGHTTAAVPPVRDDNGTEYDVMLPALVLGLRWIPAGQYPEPGMKLHVHPCDRLAHSSHYYDSDLLSAAAAAVDDVAQAVARRFPGAPTPQIAGLAAQAVTDLEATAGKLRDAADLAADEEERGRYEEEDGDSQ